MAVKAPSKPAADPHAITRDRLAGAVLATIAKLTNRRREDIDRSKTLAELGVTSFTGIVRDIGTKLSRGQLNFNGARADGTTVETLIDLLWDLNFAPKPESPRRPKPV